MCYRAIKLNFFKNKETKCKCLVSEELGRFPLKEVVYRGKERKEMR